MLRNLNILNYALIDELSVQFDKGLNILTGETGSGKSIILGALGLLTGQRADLNILSDTEKKCVVEGEFRIKSDNWINKFFSDNEIDYHEQTFIRREILPSGRSRAFINDTPVKLNVLKELGLRLVDIHSQHDTIQLNQSDFQLGIYDQFAGNTALIGVYRSLYAEYSSAKDRLRSLETLKNESLREEDYLKFQLNELNTLQLEDLDEEALEQEHKELSHAEEIGQVLDNVIHFLSESEHSILEGLQKINGEMNSLKDYSSSYSELASRIQSTKIELEDIFADVQISADRIEVDPERLHRLDEIRNLLYKLQQKHLARNVAELIVKRDDLASKLFDSDQIDVKIDKAKSHLGEIRDQLSKLAEQLSAARVKAKQSFEGEILKTLAELNLERASFIVQIEKMESPGPNGVDRLSMMFSANPDREVQSLDQAASGGELSRLMLSLKKLGAASLSSTIIFDEIDSGVSGEVAHSMGGIIRDLSKELQTICITHLPQIASKGESHFKVSKAIVEGRTITSIKQLDEEARILEIAQMLSGAKTTEAALENARDMLYLN